MTSNYVGDQKVTLNHLVSGCKWLVDLLVLSGTLRCSLLGLVRVKKHVPHQMVDFMVMNTSYEYHDRIPFS